MAYAQTSDVLSRAGRLAGAWTQTSKPGTSDIEKLLDQTAGEIDAALSSLGVTLPLDAGAPLNGPLLALNADMTLVLLIEGSWPGGAGNEETNAILEAAQARVDAAWGEDNDGVRRLVLIGLASLLDVGEEGGADDFWSANPDYGRLWPLRVDEFDPNPLLQPEVGRGMRF